MAFWQVEIDVGQAHMFAECRVEIQKFIYK